MFLLLCGRFFSFILIYNKNYSLSYHHIILSILLISIYIERENRKIKYIEGNFFHHAKYVVVSSMKYNLLYYCIVVNIIIIIK